MTELAVAPRQKVSIVTGTWQRHDLVREMIANVREQTYRPLEHIIVSDGPDPELRQLIKQLQMRGAVQPLDDPSYQDVPIVFQELGFQTSEFLAFSMSAVPFGMAQWLASGPLQMWLADDERMTPDHIERMVDLLEMEDVDFVYPVIGMWHLGQPERVNWVGQVPPFVGTISHALYRRELLDYRGFRIHVGSGTDWDQVEGWIAAGASYAMLEGQTFLHRVDKLGDGDAKRVRQPLRGHKNAPRPLPPTTRLWKGREIAESTRAPRYGAFR